MGFTSLSCSQNIKTVVALIVFVGELLYSLILNIGRKVKLFRFLYILRGHFLRCVSSFGLCPLVEKLVLSSVSVE